MLKENSVASAGIEPRSSSLESDTVLTEPHIGWGTEALFQEYVINPFCTRFGGSYTKIGTINPFNIPRHNAFSIDINM
jgi:hypothetical protein